MSAQSPGAVIKTTDGTSEVPRLTIETTASVGAQANVYFQTANLGIGTAAPGGSLHVESTASSDAAAPKFFTSNLTNGNFSEILLGKATASNQSVMLRYMLDGTASTVSLLHYGDNLWDGVTVRKGGNVGIGTTVPTKLFQVHGTGQDSQVYISSAAPSLRLGNHATYGSLTSEILLGLATSDGNFMPTALAGDGLLYVASPNGGTDRSLLFGTDGGSGQVERMRITSGGSVGIGTTAPNAALEVATATAGGVAVAILRSGGNTAGDLPALQWHSLGETDLLEIWTDSQNAYSRIKSLGPLALHAGNVGFTGDNEFLTIQTSGNVGIGSISPAAKLDIGGSTLKINGLTYTWPASIPANNYVLTAQTNGTLSWAAGGGGGLWTDGGATTYLTATGDNLAIGGTSAAAADASARTFQIGSAFVMQNTTGNQVNLAHNAHYDGSSWKYVTSDTAQAIRMYGGDIVFHLAGSGTAGNSITNWDGSDRRMIVKGSGDVGIGSISPAAKLDVGGHLRATGGVTGTPSAALDTNWPAGHLTLLSQGHMFVEAANGYNAHFTGNLYFDGTNWNRFNTSNGGAFWWVGSDGTGAFYSVAAGANPASVSPKVTFTNAGDVGIGTTAPGAKLEVAGQVKITGGSPGASKVLVSDAAGLASWSTVGGGSITPDQLDFTEFKDAMTLDATTTVAMGGFNFAFTGTGNFGVGAASPGTKLEVNITANDNTFADPDAIRFWDGSNGWQIGETGDAFFQLWRVTPSTLSGPYLTVTTGGNLGIGSTSPRGQLDAAGTGDIWLVNSPITGTAQSLFIPGHIYIAPFNGSNVSYLQARRSDSSGTTELRLRTYNAGALTEAVHITGAGNVGIGSVSPSQKLDVAGIVKGDSGFTSNNVGGTGTASYHPGGLYVPAAASTSWIYPGTIYLGNPNPATYDQTTVTLSGTLNVGQVNFKSNAGVTQAVFDKANGRIGIGTTAPAVALDVIGTAYATEVGFGNSYTRTQTKADAGAMGGRSGFYETSAPAPAADWPSGASSWWHLIDARHSNTGNNYALQIAGSFFDQNLYFRKTNNSASTAWQRILATTDAGGTTNYVAKFTGAGSLGNSQMVDDGTSVLIGDDLMIRTNDSGADPGVPWMRSNNNYLVINPSAGGNLYLSWDLANLTYMGGSLLINNAQDASGNLRFTAANPYISASSYFIAPGGAYFNIGTVYTEATIQARGGIADDGGPLVLADNPVLVNNATANTTNPPMFQIADTATDAAGLDGNVELLLKRNGYAGVGIVSSSTTASFIHFGDLGSANMYNIEYWNTDDTFVIGGNGILAVGIPRSSGNVGIGSRTPGAQLTVTENSESTTLTNFTQAVASAGILIDTEYTAGAYTPGVFWSTSNNNLTKPKAGIWLLEDGSGTDMYFGTSNDYATGITNNGLVLDQSGNVGIGVVSPAQKLDVNGQIAVGGVSVIQAGGNDVYANIRVIRNSSSTLQDGMYINYGGTGASNHIKFYTPGTTERMRIESTGNVGIGSAVPQARLDVGNGWITPAYNVVADTNVGITWYTPSPTSYGIYRTSGAWSAPYQQLKTQFDTGIILQPGPTGSAGYGKSYVEVGGGGAGLMVTYGNVGIGTTAPAALLDIVGDGSTVLLPRKSASTDPSGSNGMVYYNTGLGKFRGYQNGAWTDLIGGGGGSGITVQEADGSPSVASSTTLQFDQADGFVVSGTSPTARVDLGFVTVPAGASIGWAGGGTNILNFNQGGSRIYDNAGGNLSLDSDDGVDIQDSGTDCIQFQTFDGGNGGTILFTTNAGTGTRMIDFGRGSSSIREDAQLRLRTDDYIYLENASGANLTGIYLTTPSIYISNGTRSNAFLYFYDTGNYIRCDTNTTGQEMEFSTWGDDAAGAFIWRTGLGGSWQTVATMTQAGDIRPRNVAYTWPGANASGVLTNNGSGTLTWSAAGSGTVTSVGAGTIGAQSGSSGLIFSPSPITGSGTIAVAADALDFVHLEDTLDLDATTEINLGASNLNLDLDSTGDVQILDAGAVTHVFTDAGTVGIGTSSPGRILDVADRIRLRTGAAGTAGIWLAGSTGTEESFMGKFSDGAGDKVGFWNNGWHFIVQDDGNVSIGTTVAGAKLEVAGQVKITGGSPGANKVLKSDAAGLATWASGSGSGIDADTLDGIDSASFLRSDASDSYTSGTLTFDAATVVDINSTTLSIADTNIAFDGASTTFTGTGAMTIAPGAGTNLNVSLSGAGDFAVNTGQLYVDTSAGNVGVNSTNPQARLHIATTGATQAMLTDTDAGADLKHWGLASDTGALFLYTFTDAFAATQRLRVTSSGDYMFGNDSTAASRLHANKDDANNATVTDLLTLDHTTSGAVGAGIGAGIQFRNENSTDGNPTASSRIAGIHTDPALATITGAITFSTRNGGAALAEVMRVAGNGSVGIGSTAPQRTLDVSTASTYRIAALTAQNTTGAGLDLDAGKFGVGGRIFTLLSTGSGASAGANKLGVFDQTAAAYRMVIDSSGNVGINSNSPAAKLDVNGTTKFGGGPVYTWPTTDGANGQQLTTDGAGNLSWTAQGGGAGALWTDGGATTYLTDTADNVAIGTTSAGQKLEVAGAIKYTGRWTSVSFITGDYTLAATDEVVVSENNDAGTKVLTIPAADATQLGRIIEVVNRDGNDGLQVVVSGGQNIVINWMDNQVSSHTIGANGSTRFVCVFRSTNSTYRWVNM